MSKSNTLHAKKPPQSNVKTPQNIAISAAQAKEAVN
jgi:hypothetical protein